ncbi:MAG: hypothetical protein LC797_02915 [Chloroflexi bacterium]|nr:hypothetical protein [Chloroflexota bacterium]
MRPRGKVYEITGPEALSFSDVAEQLTAATGCPISFVDVPPEAALTDLVASGLPTWWAEYRVGVYGLYREAGPHGWAARVTNVVAEVGRPRPRTFAEFAREFRHVFVDVRSRAGQ